MEWPEGKLFPPVNVFPIITKLSLSNTAAGLGTANSFFNIAETIAETIDADNKASQTLGA